MSASGGAPQGYPSLGSASSVGSASTGGGGGGGTGGGGGGTGGGGGAVAAGFGSVVGSGSVTVGGGGGGSGSYGGAPSTRSGPSVSQSGGIGPSRLSHMSNAEDGYSPRTRSRVQLMGNDDLHEVRDGTPALCSSPAPPRACLPCFLLYFKRSLRLTPLL